MKKIISSITALLFLFLGAGLPALALAHNDHSDVDTNGDGFISTVEGQPFYGGIQASLTTSGDTSPDSALALDRFPVADSDADLNYTRTFMASDELIEHIRDGEAVIVQHGIDINRNGKYDGDKKSQLADVPFEATVPADCAVLEKADGANNFVAHLDELNSTNAEGTTWVHLDGNEVQISISASDLSPNLAHAQHIHFGEMARHECPPNTIGVDQDTDHGNNGDNGNDNGNGDHGNHNGNSDNEAEIRANISDLISQIRMEIEQLQETISDRIDAIQSQF